ncbi:hypothetical protein MKX03_017874 [Papaver bracteatum]|nr:hypothetical protein MKX03_017874 [Papaver bracteatum]
MGFRRLRKTHKDYRPHRMNRDAGLLNINVTHIPDAISEKVCEVARRCQCLSHKKYNFVEESVCALSESTNSGSSNDDPGFETESSEDVSSGGPPSPFPNLNASRVPLGREAMRGNDFSNTVFIDDSSPSDDNILVARNDFLPRGYSFNLHILSDHGLLGSGSISPRLTSENARVSRPPSIPVPDVDDGMARQPPSIPVPDVDGGTYPSSSQTPSIPLKEPDYESLQNAVTLFMNSVAELKEAHHKRSLASGVEADARQEIMRLENKIRVLTEELFKVRKELAESRELQLELFLNEIGGLLRC